MASARHFIGVELTGDTLYSAVTNIEGAVQAMSAQPLLAPEPASVVKQIGAVVATQRRRFSDLALRDRLGLSR